uniref:SEC7 domain-containing protein n=1 Tax=Caenorhabditis japonica TaxID=281687 RepID=A0A8R1HHP0_CAEJA
MRDSKEWRGTTSTSRVFVQKGYQLSDELALRKVQVLERRYGGPHLAHRAATIIQRAWREHCLMKQWMVIRHKHDTIPDLDARCGVSNSRRNELSLTSRYATSLSAQLRIDRAARSNTVDRSPPSPAPPVLANLQNSNMIESLMSPRLGNRRFTATTRCAPAASGELSATEVWLPRSSFVNHNPAHSNSLPRLDKHRVHERSESNNGRKKSEVKPVRTMTDQERKRQYRIALNFFNKKPERGVQLLTAWGFVKNSPDSLASLLFGRRGLSKSMIGEYIGTLHSPYHSLVLKYFVGMIDIRGLEVDVALRKAMQFFILPKEAEKIDRIIQAFALHYAKSNPKRTSNFRGGWDTVHLLSFAIIMLNTDLHSPNVKTRMTQSDFVKNLRGQDKIQGEKNGEDIDRKILEGIYDRIKKDELKAGDDHVAQVHRVDRAIVGKDKPRLTETPRRLVCYCRLQQVTDPTKRQSSTARERDVFLFNDMIVVAKGVRRGSTSMSGCTYTLKQWTLLLGAHITEFQRGQYEYGLTITCPNKEKIHFNARNFDDRCHFVADVTESIRETTEMEQVRLEMEMEHHTATTIRPDNQRDSGLPEIDDSMKLSNGSNSSAGSSSSSSNGVNGTSSFRRLSFNSLDSGVVEEHLEAC